MFAEHKEAGEITEAPARTMKLSEAIRKGARLRPHAKRHFFVDGRSCAWGAAYEAVTGVYREDLVIEHILAIFKDFNGREELNRTIVSLNDYGGKSREQIADWLEAQGF